MSSLRSLLTILLLQSSVLTTIGTGIVGSQAEEQGRQDLLSWREGDIYLLPSNGGKAVALLHNSKINDRKYNESGEESAPQTGTSQMGSGHAILYICKIPPSVVVNGSSIREDQSEEEGNDIPEWRSKIQSICSKGLGSFENENEKGVNGLQYQKLPEENAIQLRTTLSMV